MNENFSTRDWGDHHATLSSGIGRGLKNIADAFRVLNNRKYDAPWKVAAKDHCTTC